MKEQISLRPVPAVLPDAAPIWRLRRQLEDWLFSKGLNQWRPGEVPIETVQNQINTGEWYVYKRQGGVAAALRVLWSDPEFWGPDDSTSVYVHGLMCDRSYQGQKIGERLLDWAAQQGAARGKSFLRLDCAAENQELRDYYASRGFRAVGHKELSIGLNDVILWQRPIDVLEVGNT